MRTSTAPLLTASPSAMSRILPSCPGTCFREVTYPGILNDKGASESGATTAEKRMPSAFKPVCLAMASAWTPWGGWLSGLPPPQPAMIKVNEKIAIVFLTFIPLPSRGANLQENSSKKRALADTEKRFPNFEPELVRDLLRVQLVLCIYC